MTNVAGLEDWVERVSALRQYQHKGMALCSLHHKLFDRGALGLDEEYRIPVSGVFSARTDAAKRIYDLHGRPLHPRRGTNLPAVPHVAWHGREVFRGQPLVV